MLACVCPGDCTTGVANLRDPVAAGVGVARNGVTSGAVGLLSTWLEIYLPV